MCLPHLLPEDNVGLSRNAQSSMLLFLYAHLKDILLAEHLKVSLSTGLSQHKSLQPVCFTTCSPSLCVVCCSGSPHAELLKKGLIEGHDCWEVGVESYRASGRDNLSVPRLHGLLYISAGVI